MYIEIKKNKDGFKADLKDISGAPPIGTGKDPETAVASLMLMLFYSDIDVKKYLNPNVIKIKKIGY